MGAADRARVYVRHAAGLEGEPVAPTVYPVSDGHSWRERVDRAMSDESGPDRDDDW
jgi:hypothetical protein